MSLTTNASVRCSLPLTKTVKGTDLGKAPISVCQSQLRGRLRSPADHGSVSIVGAGTGAASSAVLTGVTLPTVSGSMREEAAGEGGVGGGWFE